MLLLMVQKSGDHQLRLVVYPIIYGPGFVHPFGGCLHGTSSKPSTGCQQFFSFQADDLFRRVFEVDISWSHTLLQNPAPRVSIKAEKMRDFVVETKVVSYSTIRCVYFWEKKTP